MFSLSSLNRVKLLVRFHALRLREFTAADIIRATGLNESSVRSVLNRMNRVEEILDREKIPAGARKKGESAIRYKLRDDPQVRLDLFKSFRDFFPSALISVPLLSTDYKAAREKIDRAINSVEPDRETLLTSAENDLGRASADESFNLAPETMRALIHYEQGRIAYCRGQNPQAQTQFRTARKIFRDRGDEGMVKLIEEYLICLEVRQLSQGRVGRPDYRGRAKSLIRLLDDMPIKTVSPLVVLMQEIIYHFPETAGQEMLQRSIDNLNELSQGLAQSLAEAMKYKSLIQGKSPEPSIYDEFFNLPQPKFLIAP